MRTTPILVVTSAVVLASLALGGAICGTPVDQDACTTDAQCNPQGGTNWRCDQGSGDCLCNSNAACDADTEFCNPQGFCQERAGCYTNLDCEAPSFCDITTGACLDPRNSSKNCSVDTHCPFLYFCNGSVCVPGCQDSSDCPLGYGCLLNTCVEGGCASRDDCDYGEKCVSNRCQPGIDSSTCRDCSTTMGRASCVASGHECLVNQTYDPSDARTRPAEYCTPTCTTDADCPMGFGCAEIFTITATCSRGETCANNQACRVGSEATTGYCPCLSNGDCPIGTGPCNEDGLCLYSMACGLFSNLQCYDVGVTNP